MITSRPLPRIKSRRSKPSVNTSTYSMYEYAAKLDCFDGGDGRLTRTSLASRERSAISRLSRTAECILRMEDVVLKKKKQQTGGLFDKLFLTHPFLNYLIVWE